MITEDRFKSLFEKCLREYLPSLRRAILNLDDYVPRDDYEKLLGRQKNFDELQRANEQMKFNLANLQRENEDLARREKKLSREKISLQAEFEDLRQELDDSRRKSLLTEKKCADLENRLAKISAEFDYYRAAYAELDAAYKNYLSLDEKIRYQLAGIFGDAQTVQGFLIGAANEKHLGDFWDYLCYALNDNRLSTVDAKVLTGLFDFCFDALNRSSREQIFFRLNTERGSRFNISTMTRTSNSRQLGFVQSVLLEGYAGRTGNIVRKSLVFIAD